jgi:hypothetical protein
LNRKAAFSFAVALSLMATHRLPAPIVEEPTPTAPQPAIKSKAKNSGAVKSPVKESSGMNSQSVQVIFTENTRAALVALRTYVEIYEKMPFAGKSDVNPNEISERLRQVLATRFRNVSISENSSENARNGLVMLFDLQTHVGSYSGNTNTVSFTATFKNGGRTIQNISASGSSIIPYPAFGTRFPKAVAAAFTDFSQKLSVAR